MPLHEPGQRLQVAERRGAYAEAIRRVRLAVADDEVPELPLRRLDRVIRLAGGTYNQARHLADDRPFRQAVERLPDDPDRLVELLDPHEISIVGVPRDPDRDVELEF